MIDEKTSIEELEKYIIKIKEVTKPSAEVISQGIHECYETLKKSKVI